MHEDLKSRGNRYLIKMIPIALILIPIIVVGFFLVLDEKEHAANLIDRKLDDSSQATQEVEGEELSWDEQLRVRWAGSTFADFIEGITILQHQAHNDISIIRFNSYDLPQEPRQVAYHLDQYPNVDGQWIHIYIDLKYDWDYYYDEVLGNWLTVEGAQPSIYLDERSKRSFKIVLDHYYMNSILLDIDGLPRLTLVPMNPLTYEVVESALDQPVYFLEAVFPFFSRKVIVSREVEHLDLLFSEHMVEEGQIGQQHQSYPGVWLATDRYRFNISPLTRALDLKHFYSLAGNHPLDYLIMINWRDTEATWINTQTGEAVPDISTIYDLNENTRYFSDGMNHFHLFEDRQNV